jgi:hypothetical protein
VAILVDFEDQEVVLVVEVGEGGRGGGMREGQKY